MEQLANMPVWAQILSMGSFMFASGVLMTRIPLAPAIILSFFCLYGVLGTNNGIPKFILYHPILFTALHILVLLPLIGIFSLEIGEKYPLIPIISKWTIGLAFLLSFIVAGIVAIRFLSIPNWSMLIRSIGVGCFILGIGDGILRLGGVFSQSGELDLIIRTSICLLLCVLVPVSVWKNLNFTSYIYLVLLLIAI